MKKILLAAGLAALSGIGLSAAENTIEPMVVADIQVTSLSPDGKMAVSALEGRMVIFNLATEEEFVYEPDEIAGAFYDGGLGNSVSATGVVLGSTKNNLDAAYWQDGAWHSLNVPRPEMSNMTNGITPDGKVICGSVGMASVSLDEALEPMLVPAIWTLKEDGTYSDAVLLPRPEKDFTGRVPQCITAVSISDDGKTIAGQMVDYSGFLTVPLVYKMNEEGEWSCAIVHSELINPENLTLPEDPGESPVMPEMKDFMSQEEIDEYEADYLAWEEECMATGNWDYENCPDMSSYISAENKAAYDAAYAEWAVLQDEWYAKFEAFNEVFRQICDKALRIQFNNIILSTDGKRLLSSWQRPDDDPMAWMPKDLSCPIMYNLEDDTFKKYELDADVVATAMGADYTILATEYATIRTAVACAPGSDEFIPLEEYIRPRNHALAEWMDENMKHDIPYWNVETEQEGVLEGMMCTGVPRCNPSMTMLVTTVEDLWEYAASCYSYILPMSDGAGLKDIAGDRDQIAVRISKGGLVNLQGDVDRLVITDLNGRVMFDLVPSSDTISTGLPAGIYIVKAIAADGTSTVVKAVF